MVRTSPVLEDGTPFPTLYYLVCPMAVRAIGRLEAHGRMAALNSQLAQDPALAAEYRGAHSRYVAQRNQFAVLEQTQSAGGMPERVKCLHALYAHECADANPIGAIVREEIEPLGCPRPCVSSDDAVPVRAAGHPGFSGKRK